MGSNIVFKLDHAGGAEILKDNNSLQLMMKTTMNEVLVNIEAQFFQTFGTEGRFELVEYTTDRSSVKIRASDARTAAILKTAPKWLDTFINNITI